MGKRLRDSILSPIFHSYIFAMYKKGSLDFLFLIYYIESRRRLRRWKNISQTLSLLQNISDRNRQTPYPPIANYKQQQAVQVSFASLMNTLIPLAGQTH